MTIQIYKDAEADTRKQTIDAFLQSLRALQAIDRTFPLQYAVCLAEIARDEGISPSTLAQRTELGLSTVSRIIAALGAHRPNGHSYQLIYIATPPGERRRKQLHLTPAGESVIAQIQRSIYI